MLDKHVEIKIGCCWLFQQRPLVARHRADRTVGHRRQMGQRERQTPSERMWRRRRTAAQHPTQACAWVSVCRCKWAAGQCGCRGHSALHQSRHEDMGLSFVSSRNNSEGLHAAKCPHKKKNSNNMQHIKSISARVRRVVNQVGVPIWPLPWLEELKL